MKIQRGKFNSLSAYCDSRSNPGVVYMHIFEEAPSLELQQALTELLEFEEVIEMPLKDNPWLKKDVDLPSELPAVLAWVWGHPECAASNPKELHNALARARRVYYSIRKMLEEK